jgi:hypothetical protein
MAKKRNLNIIPPLCACGCGRLVGTNRRGEYNKYLKGHNSKRLGLSKPSKNASTGRFKPGNTFGKGRPQGSRNNVTLAAANIFNDESETIARKAVEMALAGNTAMVKLIVERILPDQRQLFFPLNDNYISRHSSPLLSLYTMLDNPSCYDVILFHPPGRREPVGRPETGRTP